MRKQHSRVCATCIIVIILAFLFSMIPPVAVFAEGEAPEITPVEKVSPETETKPESVSNAIELLAENDAVVVDEGGAVVPLASQTALEVLCEPDPWFYSSICPGGKCSYVTITDALNYWGTNKGKGMIYLEGGYGTTNPVIEDVVINAIINPEYLTLRGIVWDTNTGGNRPQLNGTITVENLKSGFTLQGLRVVGETTGLGAVEIRNNNGTIALTDVEVTSNSDIGIYIGQSNGNIILNRVSADHNQGHGIVVSNCIWSGSGCSPSKYGIVINNTTANWNASAEPGNVVGIFVSSGGRIALNGVTAVGNAGSGLEVDGFGTSLTIKNSVFSNNHSVSDGDTYGYGLVTYVNEGNKGSIVLDNVSLAGNSYTGAELFTQGAVTIKNVYIADNGNYGVYIGKSSIMPSGAKSVLVTDSTFYHNKKINLRVVSTGVIRIVKLYSTDSIEGSGLTLDNSLSSKPQSVYILNAVLNGNGNQGGFVISKGSITLNGITATNNTGGGLSLYNHNEGAAGNISILSSLGLNQINQNGSFGLEIYSSKNIKLAGIQANNNNFGIWITGNGIASNVSLTDVETKGNPILGINIQTSGVVSINKVVSLENGSTGLFVENTNTLKSRAVTISNGTFNRNGNYGFYIKSAGFIKVNSVEAVGNASYGARLQNNVLYSPSQQLQAIRVTNAMFDSNMAGLILNSGSTVSLTNVEVYGTIGSFNALEIFTGGTAVLNKVIANDNAGTGIYINNSDTATAKLIKISNSSANNNGQFGFDLYSVGAISISGVSANHNGLFGARFKNDEITLPTQIPQGITVMKSSFDGNNLTGLTLISQGKIVFSNISASDNRSIGVDAQNSSSLTGSSIVVSGNNQFNNNLQDGIYLFSAGAVTMSGVHTINNGHFGMYVETNGTYTLKNSWINGNASHGMSIIAGGNTLLQGVTILQNGFSNNSDGALITVSSGKLIINNSVIMGNCGWGLEATIETNSDFVLSANTIVLGNDAGPVFGEGNYRRY